jgi:predicted RNase H-like HicB family nuclease
MRCICSYNERMSRKFDVELTIGEDGWWVVECPSLPGCVSQGRTEEEALENIKEAIQACLEVRRELGLPESVIRRTVEVAA